MILHCMKKTTGEERKNKAYWGKRSLEANGFIHCSTVENFWRVAPNFRDVQEELVLVCMDENKLLSEVRYEDGGDGERLYPHIYGLVNNDAVVMVLPFLRKEDGTYIKNPEFAGIQEKQTPVGHAEKNPPQG